jgi:hypothetical protein
MNIKQALSAPPIPPCEVAQIIATLRGMRLVLSDEQFERELLMVLGWCTGRADTVEILRRALS